MICWIWWTGALGQIYLREFKYTSKSPCALLAYATIYRGKRAVVIREREYHEKGRCSGYHCFTEFGTLAISGGCGR
jgi:hypothetical protein